MIESAHTLTSSGAAAYLLLHAVLILPISTPYRGFTDEVIGRLNANRRKALEAERPQLKALRPRRTDDFEETLVTVTPSCGFFLRRVSYTVLSRLIG